MIYEEKKFACFEASKTSQVMQNMIFYNKYTISAIFYVLEAELKLFCTS